jgi:hypothetical protein
MEMKVLNTGFSRMTFVAREYCELIEELDNYDDAEWLSRLADVLSRLEDAVELLKTPQSAVPYRPEADMEARFELFSRVYQKIGEREGFQNEFDSQHGGRRLSGSLADDLTDIYFDLKRGLGMLTMSPQRPDAAMQIWKQSHDVHWRHHLTDALRQFNAMAVQHPGRR